MRKEFTAVTVCTDITLSALVKSGMMHMQPSHHAPYGTLHRVPKQPPKELYGDTQCGSVVDLYAEARTKQSDNGRMHRSSARFAVVGLAFRPLPWA